MKSASPTLSRLSTCQTSRCTPMPVTLDGWDGQTIWPRLVLTTLTSTRTLDLHPAFVVLPPTLPTTTPGASPPAHHTPKVLPTATRSDTSTLWLLFSRATDGMPTSLSTKVVPESNQ